MRALAAACLFLMLISLTAPFHIVPEYPSGGGEPALMTLDVCNAGASAVSGNGETNLVFECPGIPSPPVVFTSLEAVSIASYRFTPAFLLDPPPRT
jgi:hypothetical protein